MKLNGIMKLFKSKIEKLQAKITEKKFTST